MELNNPKYKNIGIHLVTTIFTVDKGVTKVLLIKRNNEPFKGYWALPGGAMYNDERILDGALRELKEKVGIKDIDLSLYKVFDKIDRSPLKRMIALAYIGVLDIETVELLKETPKASEISWVELDRVPELAYDFNEILNAGIEELKDQIVKTDILKSLFPNGFTLPELHNVYTSILGIEVDRRNFRKKMINLNLIKDTNKTIVYKGKKPAKLYVFNDIKEHKSIF